MTQIAIPPMNSRYVLTTGHTHHGPPQYYTGRGGDGWIGARSEAFTMGEGEARRKAETLNRMKEVHGFNFWIEGA